MVEEGFDRQVFSTGQSTASALVSKEPERAIARLSVQKANYASRAGFKLLEIQKKHKLILKGSSVLDLGCAPGAWLQVACQELGPRQQGGFVLGIDLKHVTLPDAFIDDRVTFLKADARTLTPRILHEYAPLGFDVMLSDMLHSTSGHAAVDVGTSLELTGMALHLAVGYYHDLHGQQYATTHDEPAHSGTLRSGGHLVMKMYEGAGTIDFVKDARGYFDKVSRMRPDAVRKASREFYLICKGRKQSNQ